MDITLEVLDLEDSTQCAWIDPIRTARALLAEHDHFFGRTDRFEFEQADEVLVVRGQVPSFYLKQLLQTALRAVAGVERIENRVDVVCSDGLSSVRRR